MSAPPGKRSRPAGNRTASKSDIGSTDNSSVPSNPLAELSIGRRTWSRRYIESRVKRIRFGSTEWLMLDDSDPDKLAAAVVAAETYASADDTLEDDLRREIEGLRAGFKREEDAAYQRQAAEHRARYGNPAVRKSFQQRRAEQLAAAEPKPDDSTGGPVSWNGGAS
jgi:hypothetical protein